MKKLIQKLIKECDYEGRDLIQELKSEFLKYNGKELIIKLLNTADLRYNNIFSILSMVPELWKDFNLEDWQEIIRAVDRPENYRVLIDDEPHFEDIRFLYNWIGIDSVSLYKNDAQISEKNKKALDRVFPYFLVDNFKGLYKEDFEDGTYGNIEYFREMKQRLIEQGAKPSPRADL